MCQLYAIMWALSTYPKGLYQMEEFIQQIVYQAPAVGILLYLLLSRESRIKDLENRMDECLESKNDDNPHKYTYPPK